MASRERTDQKRRTRQDLLQAAMRLMKRGQVPKLAEVAEEAMVSRATAYRYFSSDEALLAEAPMDSLMPDAEDLFPGDAQGDAVADPEERLLTADAAMRRVIWGNHTQLRLMLARLLEQAARANGPGVNGTGANGTPGEPLRQNRRMDFIEAALAPARDRFDTSSYQKLCAALALVFGTESMVVFRDVLQMEDAAAWEVESWMVRVLARAALADSRAEAGSGTSKPSGRHGSRSLRGRGSGSSQVS